MRQDTSALRELWAAWVSTLDGIPEHQWDRPTVNSEWNVHQTVAHHAQAVRRLDEFAGARTDLPIEKLSAAEFLGQFGRRPDDASLVAAAAIEEADTTSPAELVRMFREHGPKAVDKAEAAGDVVVQTDEGRIVLSEYVRSRIIEGVVHLIDVQEGLGMSIDIPASALKIAAHSLVEFAPLVEFIKSATGRSAQNLFPVFA